MASKELPSQQHFAKGQWDLLHIATYNQRLECTQLKGKDRHFCAFKDKKNPHAACRKAFNSNSDLARHEAAHVPEGGFSCDECPKTFKQQTHLNTHKDSKHNVGDFPHKCTCGYASKDSSPMYKHFDILTDRAVHDWAVYQRIVGARPRSRPHGRAQRSRRHGTSPTTSPVMQPCQANNGFAVNANSAIDPTLQSLQQVMHFNAHNPAPAPYQQPLAHMGYDQYQSANYSAQQQFGQLFADMQPQQQMRQPFYNTAIDESAMAPAQQHDQQFVADMGLSECLTCFSLGKATCECINDTASSEDIQMSGVFAHAPQDLQQAEMPQHINPMDTLLSPPIDPALEAAQPVQQVQAAAPDTTAMPLEPGNFGRIDDTEAVARELHDSMQLDSQAPEPNLRAFDFSNVAGDIMDFTWAENTAWESVDFFGDAAMDDDNAQNEPTGGQFNAASYPYN